ncbi:hypothetical protein H9C73_11940 [Marinobacterium sp. AK62]|uniref:DUF481 domain-containing protein n=1 Tax=Marinobacterium alkalitolerans TaxID=1542925 RepID=A0ABS3ZCP7_9GAMM|nr:hypothetical protein [Marinobacterium alkalitolerans]MBP0049449.1 hypothetical protein [Marinobacterium alkalitolerans]
MIRRLPLLAPCLFPALAFGLDFEVKTDLEHTRHPVSNEIKYEDDGSFDERDYRHKTGYESKTLLLLSDAWSEQLDWELRLGMQYDRTRDTKREFREDGSLKKDKSRTEWQSSPILGLGFSYDMGRLLGGYHWRLSGYHDRFVDVAYKATSLAEDAKPRAGRGDGYESRLRLDAEYMTPVSSLFFSPRLEVTHERYSQWYDTARERDEAAEQELQYEASLWVNWIPPLNGWEVTLGPTWQLEDKAERDTDTGQWEWEDEERWIGRVQLEYEAPLPGFEFEFKVERDLNGPDRDKMKYEAGLSYEF